MTKETFRYRSTLPIPCRSNVLSSPRPLLPHSTAVLKWRLVGDPPRVKPLQIAVLPIGSHHTPRNRHEEHVQPNSRRIQKAINSDLKVLNLASKDPIRYEAESENSEVERGIVVMDISDTSHSHEWHVVQEPSNNGVDTSIVDLINVDLLELVVTALPADQVPGYHEGENAEGGRRAPVHEWVAEEEVLDNGVVPTAHTETDVENRPLPELGCKIVLLIRIGNKGIVRGHHGYVQVDEVLEEGRLVCSGISGGY